MAKETGSVIANGTNGISQQKNQWNLIAKGPVKYHSKKGISSVSTVLWKRHYWNIIAKGPVEYYRKKDHWTIKAKGTSGLAQQKEPM